MEFSFVGYVTKGVPTNGRSEINVVLEVSISSLDQVVVVGYGTQKKSDLTSAIASVNANDIKDLPDMQVGQALQGKVAGVEVSQNSGNPASGLLIRIRGTGTVNNADPLYVVDGNPNVDPRDLVPEQIESIQILKSASAAAIYGAQGANGVILITTKQGKAGKPQMDLNISGGLQTIQKYYPSTNAFQYATLYNEGLVNAGQAPIYPDPASLGVGTDWQRAVFRKAPMSNTLLSVTGGDANDKYYFSAGYFNQLGILKGSYYDRMNLRINSSHDVTKNIRLGENISASLSKYANFQEFYFGSVLGNTLTANPTIPVKNPDGSWGYTENSLNSANPLASIAYHNDKINRPVVNGNIYADITFLRGLVYHSQLNFNYGNSQEINFSPYYVINSRNQNLVASLDNANTIFKQYSFANTLTYSKSVGKHTFDILGGVTTEESRSEYTDSYAQGLPNNATDQASLRYLNLGTYGYRTGGNAGEWGIISFLGRINYNYESKYFSTINFRRDGSSKFGVNNKFGNFPSFSLGWKISNEAFMKKFTWMDNLMLRGGWGSLGNEGSLPNYAFADLVTSNINYTFGYPQFVATGQAPIGQGNPDLKWESTSETNVGLDFTGDNGKITASFDWYDKKTKDMLLRVPVIGISGVQNAPYVNGGDIENKGVEIMVGYQNTTPGGFNYNLSGNIAFNRNKVLRLSNSGSAIFTQVSFVGLINRTQVGDPIASFYGWQTDGIFKTQDQIDKSPFQSAGTSPGDWKFKDLDGDGVITAADQTVIGNPSPKFTYGFNSSFSYKGFSLRLQLQGVYGNQIYEDFKFRVEGANFFNYNLNVWNNRYQSPSNPGNGKVPRLTTSDPNNNMRSSDYYVEPGSYMRIKNIQLGYMVPKSVVNVRSLSMYFSVQNALTFTKYPGFDPEIGTNTGNNPLYIGIDETNYPIPRIYTLGFKFGL